jgi:hypothetical protein
MSVRGCDFSFLSDKFIRGSHDVKTWAPGRTLRPHADTRTAIDNGSIVTEMAPHRKPGDRQHVPQVLIHKKKGERPVCPRVPRVGYPPGRPRIRNGGSDSEQKIGELYRTRDLIISRSIAHHRGAFG